MSDSLPRQLRRLCWASFSALLWLGAPANARAAGGLGAVDSASANPSVVDPADENLPPYHHSLFSWEHTLNAATLGVGATPQSADPTYTMGLVAKTRWYFLDDFEVGRHFSLRLDGGLYSELTNNDFTTRRGEWTFSDTTLSSVYSHRLRGRSDRDGTLLELRPLTLELPTSKVSYESGRYFGAGALIGINQVTPWLVGKVDPPILSTLRLAVGYAHNFARATVPTNETLERVRLTPDGRTLPGDALSGSALVRDVLDFSVRLRLELGKSLLWTTDAAVAPSWKYAVQRDVQLCGVVQTGCSDVQLAEDDTRYLVRTQFSTEFSLRIARAFSVELGYANLAAQIGPDGRRRGFFNSPAAIFYTSLSFFPHELASSAKQTAASASAPSTL
ncbi:MAG TPA: hypothetical protein VEQ58_01785 [Polyangiaceae bacterium]|nr:hypothetical protein [Polyangiaceae bacterium]